MGISRNKYVKITSAGRPAVASGQVSNPKDVVPDGTWDTEGFWMIDGLFWATPEVLA